MKYEQVEINLDGVPEGWKIPGEWRSLFQFQELEVLKSLSPHNRLSIIYHRLTKVEQGMAEAKSRAVQGTEVLQTGSNGHFDTSEGRDYSR